MSSIEPISADPPFWGRRPLLRQGWRELAFLHWAYDPAVVQQCLPPGVRVDTFDGAAWVGLVPFEMCEVRIGPTPAMPWVGSFTEINVRTYVTDELGRRAVWFFSLDVPRGLVVVTARSMFNLPYCWARTEHARDGARHHYTMVRRWPRAAPARADIDFTVGEVLEPDEIGPLEHFLSARWALVTTRGSKCRYGQVDHARWPLHRIDSCTVDQDLFEAGGLPAPEGPPHTLYSPGVQVEVARFRTVTLRPAPATQPRRVVRPAAST